MSPRHLDERPRPVETHRLVADGAEVLQVAARPATEIEDGEGRIALDRFEQRRDVLADVVVASALPEGAWRW